MKNINNKIMSGMEMMEFFFTNEWHWSVKNAEALREVLCLEDQSVMKILIHLVIFYRYLNELANFYP